MWISNGLMRTSGPIYTFFVSGGENPGGSELFETVKEGRQTVCLMHLVNLSKILSPLDDVVVEFRPKRQCG
jgi:hypothetical protein